MSHEVRTPLNSMMILAQMLEANEEGNLSPQQREWATAIHAGGRDLLALINQILDLSKVEAGRVDTHFEPTTLDSVRTFAETTFRPVAIQRGLDFAIDLAPSAPATVTTDRQLLHQILKNLLSNAFKFTESGRVQLRIDRAPADAHCRTESLRSAPGAVAFTVTDTGIGIALEHQEAIFAAFQQADATVTRRFGGTGLGLTISREYARVLGGDITVRSKPSAGSTFVLCLPLTAVDLQQTRQPAPRTDLLAPAPPDGPALEDAAALAGKKILVVEDDARNLYATAGFLEHHRAVVLAASNARDAIATLQDHPEVDLVLMDVMMPETDGLQATRQIRAKKEFATLPIVALTAKASETDRDVCLAAGCNDFVVKPVETPQLVSIIARHIRRPA
jgi:CheY-like chemotaxis protein